MATFQIITIGGTTQADGSFSVSGVFWLTSPTNNVVPSPSRTSVVPGILAADLAALRSGAIVEQPFTTGQYASGTTQATVDADLQTRFTAAQTALNNTNPALATAVLRAFNGATWAALGQVAPPAAVSATAGAIFTTTPWAAALGLIPGITFGRSTGYTANATAAIQKIRAGTYAPALPGAAAQRSLSSASANDAAAGTGARTVLITYLTTAFVVKTETVTLNGVTAVNTVGTDIAYIESIVVATCGSGLVNAGVITLFNATAGGGGALATILASDNQTFFAHHYVPAGKTCYVVNASIGGSLVAGIGTANRTGDPSQINLPTVGIGGQYPHILGGLTDHDFRIPIPVPGPDLIVLSEKPNAATVSNVAYGTFEWIQY
jgi:hypothetical protein